jgi:hypothetical protein
MPNQGLGRPGGLISTLSVANKKVAGTSPGRLKMVCAIHRVPNRQYLSDYHT